MMTDSDDEYFRLRGAAYDEGYRASANGEGEETNPYVDVTLKGYWVDGWNDHNELRQEFLTEAEEFFAKD